MRHLLRHAENILRAFGGELPLHLFLKQYFSANKALGSRDRRALATITYSYFRASKAIDSPDLPTRIAAAMLLCGADAPVLRGLFPESWLPALDRGTDGTAILRDAGILTHIDRLLPQGVAFSAPLQREDYLAAMLRQPRLFLRIRKDRQGIQSALQSAGIQHEWLSETCLALPNGTRIEGLLPEQSYVVQDVSSQATGRMLQQGGEGSWWDVCCGAGGKTLLLRDLMRTGTITATDIRPSILRNLLTRFERYRLSAPETFVVDASEAAGLRDKMNGRKFHAIVCDVPCSGSGTWGRTPEGAFFFDPSTLAGYSGRQAAILHHAAAYLRPGGTMVYLTCSVFEAENEDVVAGFLKQNPHFTLVGQELFDGLPLGGDCLFGAVLRRGD